LRERVCLVFGGQDLSKILREGGASAAYAQSVTTTLFNASTPPFVTTTLFNTTTSLCHGGYPRAEAAWARQTITTHWATGSWMPKA
jgi:hypothetical protein